MNDKLLDLQFVDYWTQYWGINILIFKTCLISIAAGIGLGILSSYAFKLFKPLNLSRIQEGCIFIFFVFISYSLANLEDLSAALTLLVTGIMMSHYAYYNLSFQAKEESRYTFIFLLVISTRLISKFLETTAEAFVFTYLGLASYKIFQFGFVFYLVFFCLLFIVLTRLFVIFGLSFILEYIRCLY